MSADGKTALAQALRAQQLQTHRANLPWALGGSLCTGLVLLALLWGAVPAALLLGWLAGLVAVLALRGGIALWPRRSVAPADADRARLRAYRLGFAAHGLVWGLGGMLPLPAGDVLHVAMLLTVLTGITASSFTLTSFDVAAALWFGAPTLGLLALRLFQAGQPLLSILGAAALGALFFLGMTARRASGVIGQYVALRLAEVEQAAALRSSEELLERTGATAGVGGWALDPASRTLRLTAQACHIHGLPPATRLPLAGFIGRYPAAQQPALGAAFEAALLQGLAFDLVLPLAPPGAAPRWVRLIGQPQPPAAGTSAAPAAGASTSKENAPRTGVSGVVQDITHARSTELALAEKHRLLALLVETTSEGFWFVDPDAVTTDANPAMCAILGQPREALIGRSIFEFVDEANRAIFAREIDRRAQGIAGGYEIELTRADGSKVCCFNHATPIFDHLGVRLGSIGMWTDISERKRTEQELRRTSEALQQKSQALQDTLDSISQGIVSHDGAGELRVYNRRLRELLDLPEQLFAAGASFQDAVDFQERRGDLQPGESFLDLQGRPQQMPEDRRLWPDVYVRRGIGGRLIEVRSRHMPDGGLVRTFTDVTAYVEAERALRDSEHELQALLAAFPGLIVVMDGHHRYTYVNEPFAALVGMEREQLIGRSVRELLGEARFVQVLASMAKARPGAPFTTESEYEATAFRPRTVLQVTHAVGAEDAEGRRKVFAFGIDISARKAAEQALIAAKNEAERANLAKSQFLSSMSHELRTPLNAILGFGQLLMTDTTPPLAERQRAQLGEIVGGARHLLRLINEVLDLAVVETGRLRVDLGAVPLAPLLEEALGLLRPLADENGITLALTEPPGEGNALQADATRLKQVLLNLVGNAIKYNQRGGFVRVACRRSGARLRITISDSGPGLNPGQIERLFGAFERLDAGHTPVEGSGLGLALSRGLVQAMRGEIGVQSQPGQGSSFWVELPLAEPAPTPAGPAASERGPPALPAPGPARRKLLYIEDNPVNVLLMEAMIDRLPHLTLVSAALPEQGLRLAVAERPALILLDIQLPGIDGFEVLRRLRQQQDTQAIPVFAVSANAMPAAIEQGRAAGFQRYLTKPLDFELLRAAIDEVLPA